MKIKKKKIIWFSKLITPTILIFFSYFSFAIEKPKTNLNVSDKSKQSGKSNKAITLQTFPLLKWKKGQMVRYKILIKKPQKKIKTTFLTISLVAKTDNSTYWKEVLIKNPGEKDIIFKSPTIPPKPRFKNSLDEMFSLIDQKYNKDVIIQYGSSPPVKTTSKLLTTVFKKLLQKADKTNQEIRQIFQNSAENIISQGTVKQVINGQDMSVNVFSVPTERAKLQITPQIPFSGLTSLTLQKSNGTIITVNLLDYKLHGASSAINKKPLSLPFLLNNLTIKTNSD